MFDVNPSLLRYWEEHFPQLKPQRSSKGNRRYTAKDIEVLKTIYHLVKERGMRIEGAVKALRERRHTASVASNAELLEHLQRIRALLVEVREELKTGDERLLSDDEDSATATDEAATPAIDKGGKAVVTFTDETAEPKEERPKNRRPRRKKDENEKELFAFYEQSLF